MKNRRDKAAASTSFRCADADSDRFDKTNGAYSPRNDAYRNAQRFYDMWRKLIGTSPHGLFDSRKLV